MDNKRNYQGRNAATLLDYPEDYRHNWTMHLHRMNRKQNSKTHEK